MWFDLHFTHSRKRLERKIADGEFIRNWAGFVLSSVKREFEESIGYY